MMIERHDGLAQLAFRDDRLLTLKEFHRRLARSEGWVRAQVEGGAIPAVFLGRELRFRESTLIQLMNRGLPGPALPRRAGKAEDARRSARAPCLGHRDFAGDRNP